MKTVKSAEFVVFVLTCKQLIKKHPKLLLEGCKVFLFSVCVNYLNIYKNRLIWASFYICFSRNLLFVFYEKTAWGFGSHYFVLS